MNAVELFTELISRGVELEAEGGRLKVDAPKGAVTLEMREALMTHKSEVLALLQSYDDETRWRVKAMLPQIPLSGPIPFLQARAGLESIKGGCPSCGEPLKGKSFRCQPCGRAANLALELALHRTQETLNEVNSVN